MDFNIDRQKELLLMVETAQMLIKKLKLTLTAEELYGSLSIALVLVHKAYGLSNEQFMENSKSLLEMIKKIDQLPE